VLGESIVSKNVSQTDAALNWLSQFEGPDKSAATTLLDGITWISDVEFESTLRSQIAKLCNSIEGPIALYVEREVRKVKNGIQRFYKQNRKPKTAYGAALQMTESLSNVDQEVGSEGKISTIATQISRENKRKIYLHPTIKQVKDYKIENFIILTDTIGSGSQTRKFVQSFWEVATIKSLKSFKRLSFHVVAYAATKEGLKNVESHPAKPKVHYQLPCPTLHSVFCKEQRVQVESLCEKYYLKDKTYGPFGYENGGVLLAYSHGIPNNAPTILHRRSKKRVWPLFVNRAIGDQKFELNIGKKQINFTQSFIKNGQLQILTSKWIDKANRDAKEFVLVITSLNKAPRTISAVSERTQVKISDVENHLNLAKQCCWVSDNMRLTDAGLMLIKKIKEKKKLEKVVTWNVNLLYYPKSLRVSF